MAVKKTEAFVVTLATDINFSLFAEEQKKDKTKKCKKPKARLLLLFFFIMYESDMC